MATPSDADLEFSIHLDALGAQAVAERRYADADYFFTAADFYAEPSDGARTARMMLLCSAMAGEAARARTEAGQ